jgi:secreted PhoX family phosphatase
MAFSRRKFLTLAGATAAGVTMVSPLEAFYAKAARGQVATGTGYGTLEPKLPLNAGELTDTLLGDLSSTPLLELPPGFNYRAFSIVGQPMSDGSLVPADHDGMAAFPGPNNTVILIRNHELSPTEVETFPNRTPFPLPVVAPDNKKYSTTGRGGTTTLVVGANRKLVKDFSSLAGTWNNCAGGPTPWGSWISCEETFNSFPQATNPPSTQRHGYNFEVAASAEIGLVDPIPLRSMGRFSHEAIAVDPKTNYIYETEDRNDSCFYRFVPKFAPQKPGDLARGEAQGGGTLYALKYKDYSTFVNTTNNPNFNSFGGVTNVIKVGVPMQVEWVGIDVPNPDVESTSRRLGVRYEAQSKGAAVFFRGEGAWYGQNEAGESLIYFIATQGGPAAFDDTRSAPRGNGQVWLYNVDRETLTLLIEADPNPATTLLDEPDNIVVSPFGDLFICEDGGGVQFVVGINKQGELYQFARNAYNESEFAGACFSPDGKTMFVNIQTPGITYAIWGPWSRRRS